MPGWFEVCWPSWPLEVPATKRNLGIRGIGDSDGASAPRLLNPLTTGPVVHARLPARLLPYFRAGLAAKGWAEACARAVGVGDARRWTATTSPAASHRCAATAPPPSPLGCRV